MTFWLGAAFALLACLPYGIWWFSLIWWVPFILLHTHRHYAMAAATFASLFMAALVTYWFLPTLLIWLWVNLRDHNLQVEAA